ncbi:MAG: sodium/glutamate symporter [Bacillota bacterium]
MDTPFPFEPLLVFGFMAIMLLLGMLLRSTIKFFQTFLIPSCFIGGIAGLVLVSTGLVGVSTDLLETFAYHLFIISFISLGLTTNFKKDSQFSVISPVRGSLWMGFVSGVVMAMQAIIGALFVFLFNTTGFELHPTFGFLSPLGFTQGPGQALSIGRVWQEFGFENAATLGLSFAVFGFAFAFFVGVPLVNWGIRKGYSAEAPKELPRDFLTGITQKDAEKKTAGALTTHSGSTDVLAFHVALVGLVYVLTYLLVLAINHFTSVDAAQSMWGFFFFFGILVAIFLKFLITRLGLDYLLDPGIQRRITGWSVDFLIIATVMAIQVVVVWDYILPIVVISMFSGVLTTIVVISLGRRTWAYSLERTAGIYGITTGNASTGLLLLRISDPEFKTPVGIELGVQAIFSAPFVLSYMMLMHAPFWWGWSIELVTLIYAGLMILSLILLKLFKFLGPRKF